MLYSHSHPHSHPFPPIDTANNITVLSLGAGSFPRHTNVFSAGKGEFLKDQTGKDQELYRADWGIKQWIPFLLDLLLDGDTVTTEMVMHYLLGNTFLSSSHSLSSCHSLYLTFSNTM